MQTGPDPINVSIQRLILLNKIYVNTAIVQVHFRLYFNIQILSSGISSTISAPVIRTKFSTLKTNNSIRFQIITYCSYW